MPAGDLTARTSLISFSAAGVRAGMLCTAVRRRVVPKLSMAPTRTMPGTLDSACWKSITSASVAAWCGMTISMGFPSCPGKRSAVTTSVIAIAEDAGITRESTCEKTMFFTGAVRIPRMKRQRRRIATGLRMTKRAV